MTALAGDRRAGAGRLPVRGHASSARAFYVMDYVEAASSGTRAAGGGRRRERRADLRRMNRVIAALHSVDYAAVGLADYGKPGNYFARQMARWTKQYRASETEKIEAMDRLIEWLPQHIPPTTRPASCTATIGSTT